MPLKGLSWFRLKEHFRKAMPIYLFGIIGMLFVSNLLYTTTRPQTPDDQAVLMYLADSYTNVEPLTDLAAEALAAVQQQDETLQEVTFVPLMFNDPATDYNSAMLLMTRMSIGDGDVFFASAAGADYICRSEVALPLDEYLANGWLEGLDLEPLYFTHPETNETYIAGIKLDNVTSLITKNVMNCQGAAVIIAVNGTNIETSMATVEHVLRELVAESVPMEELIAAYQAEAEAEAAAATAEPAAEG